MESCREINDVRPSSIRHIVGQSGVVKQVSVALDAAFADARRFDSALLVGPPGVGKSALAAVIAQEMASDFHEVLGQSIRTPADLNALLLAAKDKSVIHIDEAHELKREYQTALYLATDKQTLVVPSAAGAPPISLPLADFTLLLSSTDEFCLLQPLRDRMKLLLRFDFYTPDELAMVVVQRAKGLGWDVEETAFPMIAARARGTPRLALRLLQAARRVCRSKGEQTITLAHLTTACELEGIDALGLGPTEQKYLAIVAHGPTRLNVIASTLGLPTRTVSQVTEQFLVRAGLVMKDDQGRRQLTQQGREHVQQLSNS